MCGISVEIFTCSCHAACARSFEKIPELLLNRGPDASSNITVQLREGSIVLKGTVLWLQGAEPVAQPIRDEDGNILLFNGDVLAGNQMPGRKECDSVHLLQQLRAAGNKGVPGVMSDIIGPWAFIYWRAATQQLYFGRDVLGRHSLLWSKTETFSQSDTPENGLKFEHGDVLPGTPSHSPSFVLSSVSFGSVEMEEVPANGIFVLDVKDLNCGPVTDKRKLAVALMPWSGKSDPLVDKGLNVEIQDNISLTSPIQENLNMAVPEVGIDHEIGYFEGNILEHLHKKYVCYTDKFLFLLQCSVQRRVDACPPCCGKCTENWVAQQSGLCSNSGSDRAVVCPAGVAAENSFSKDNNSLWQISNANTSLEVSKFGFAGTDEHKSTHIGKKYKPEPTSEEGTHVISDTSSKSKTSDEVGRHSHCLINEHVRINSDESSQQYTSSSSHENIESFNDNIGSCTRFNKGCSHCRIAVLFSGGLDSAMIAFLLDRCLPKEESIDLINVAFPSPRPKAPVKTKKKLNLRRPNTNASHESLKSEEICQEFEFENRSKNVLVSAKDEENLSAAQSVHEEEEAFQSLEILHVSSLDPVDAQNLRESESCGSQLRKMKGDRISSQSTKISLISSQNEGKKTDEDYEVPDRRTGKVCLEQLRSLCPDRHWNFVEVNVSREELSEHRAHRIISVLRPHNTVLDDSIGCALWFAGRAQGVARGEPYTSSARVLLCGHGADEQLCGYSRHRSVYGTGGIEALLEEIRMEVERLPSRNLGRDNRVLADSARAPRFPYLDEDVVSYLNSLPIWVKADLSLPRGVGEKLLLRVLAYQLGLTVAAGLPKRAIQFGSRIAKMDDRKEKGDQVCGRLLNG